MRNDGAGSFEAPSLVASYRKILRYFDSIRKETPKLEWTASDGFEIFGEERVGEEALAADLLDKAAREELFLGGVDCRGGAEGVTVAVGVVETGGGFAGKGGQKGLLGGREGEHLLFVLVAVESGKVGAHPGEQQALTKNKSDEELHQFSVVSGRPDRVVLAKDDCGLRAERGGEL